MQITMQTFLTPSGYQTRPDKYPPAPLHQALLIAVPMASAEICRLVINYFDEVLVESGRH
jgi:hypothetical protein